MTEPHPLGIVGSAEAIESVGPEFLREGLFRAREKTKAILEAIQAEIKIGMTEDEGRLLALKISSDFGIKKHWHKPYLRFGPGTLLHFHDPLQKEYRLQENDLYYIDLGVVCPDPVQKIEYEGDYGDTFTVGNHPDGEKCAALARALFQESHDQWKSGTTTGEQIYTFLKKRCDELGYHLVEDVDGHRVSDFPHQRFSKAKLAELPFIPSDSLWILEVQINEPKGRFGAFFEDIL